MSLVVADHALTQMLMDDDSQMMPSIADFSMCVGIYWFCRYVLAGLFFNMLALAAIFETTASSQLQGHLTA